MKRLALASAVAVAIALAGSPAWGHTFPQVRTVVVQVESCELAVLVGYRPATGEATQALLSRVSNTPNSLRDVMTNAAIAPLSFLVDGKPLVPTSVRAKLGLEPGGERPMVVVLVTFPLPAGKALEVRSKDTRTTAISWTDLHSNRVDLLGAVAQGKMFVGVASFLLTLAAGESSCASPTSRSSRPLSR